MGYNKRADFPSLSSQVWNQPLKMSWAYQWHSVTMSISSIFTCFICFVSIIMFILQSFPKKMRFSATIDFFTPPSVVCCGIALKMMRDTLGLEVNIQSSLCIHIYITTHLKRVPVYVIDIIFTCWYFSHTHIIYIYIYTYYVAHVLINVDTSICYIYCICIDIQSILPLSFTSTLQPESGKTCVIFVALMASSSCRPHPWHVAPWRDRPRRLKAWPSACGAAPRKWPYDGVCNKVRGSLGHLKCRDTSPEN